MKIVSITALLSLHLSLQAAKALTIDKKNTDNAFDVREMMNQLASIEQEDPCEDRDGTNLWGDGCDWYKNNGPQTWCGRYDTAGF